MKLVVVTTRTSLFRHRRPALSGGWAVGVSRPEPLPSTDSHLPETFARSSGGAMPRERQVAAAALQSLLEPRKTGPARLRPTMPRPTPAGLAFVLVRPAGRGSKS